MAYPITVAGLVNSTILSYHDIFKPQVAKELYQAYGMPSNTFMNLMRMWGRVIPIQDITHYFYEEGWKWFPVTVRANVADPGVGNPANVTLAVADHLNGRIFPVVGETIILPAAKGFIEVRIQDIDATNPAAQVLTLIPVRATDNIGALTAGTQLAIYSAAYGDGTGQPDGKTTFPIKREFSHQIIKEATSFTGRSIVRPTWYEVDEVDGKKINGLYAKEIAEAEMRLELKEANAYFMGQESTNPLLRTSVNEAALYGGKGAGSYVTKTKGFYRWIDELGYTMPVALNTESVTDFEDIVDYQKSQGLTSALNLVMIGQTRLNRYDTELKDYLDTNCNEYVRGMVKNTPGGREGYDVMFDFAKVKKSGAEFIFVPMAEFDNPRILNLSGYDMSQYAVVAPLTTVADSKLKTTMPNMAITYLSNNGYNRQKETWRTGGCNGVYTTEIDEQKVNLKSDTGYFGAHHNQCVIIQP